MISHIADIPKVTKPWLIDLNIGQVGWIMSGKKLIQLGYPPQCPGSACLSTPRQHFEPKLDPGSGLRHGAGPETDGVYTQISYLSETLEACCGIAHNSPRDYCTVAIGKSCNRSARGQGYSKPLAMASSGGELRMVF